MAKKEIEVEESSGNVFKDLGLKNPEERIVKAKKLFETAWAKRMERESTPGGNLRAYRENRELTQAQLGEQLDIPRQHVSNMENGHRAISIAMAKKLARIFKTRVDRFI